MENNYENENIPEQEVPQVDVEQEAPVEQEEQVETPVEPQEKEKFPKEKIKLFAILGAAAVAVVVAVLVLISVLTNTYKTPIKAMEKLENAKRFTSTYDKVEAITNGLCKKEIKGVIKTLEKCEDYKDELADAKEDFKDSIEDLKDEYGSNYKITYKVTDKEKLDKDDLKDFRDTLRSAGKSLVNEFEDLESDDYEDIADELGLKKAQAKDLAKDLEKLGKELKGVKVTAGYELTVERMLTGSEVEDEEPEEDTICVYKVNGRWVSETVLYALYALG